jgi:vacuolar-type H+-ATPase subunit E/Vma4
MDKSRQPKLGITVRDGDAKGVLDVTLLDSNNTPFNLTGKRVVFREEKENNKWIEDDAGINVDDPTRGHLTYVLHQQAQVIGNGKAWFKVISDDGTIDSSQSFYITVEKGFEMAITNSNYISEFEELRTKLDQITIKADSSYKAELQDLKDRGNQSITAIEDSYKKASANFQSTFDAAESARQTEYTADKKQRDDTYNADKTARDDAFKKQASDQATQYATDKKARDDQYSSDKSTRDADWANGLAKIKQDAQNEADSIQKAASDQVKTIQQAADKQNSDNQAAWNTEKQSLIDSWHQTEQGFQTTLSSLQTTVDSLQKAVAKLNSTDLPTAQSDMDALKKQIADAKASFDSVDFSQYMLKKDTYDRDTIDQKLKESGKVQTVNGVAPDSQGNVTVDTSNFATKAEVNAKGDVKTVDGVAPDASGNVATGRYTNQEIDDKLAQAGKLKTISLNGGAKIEPDSEGNADLTVPQPDLSAYATKTDLQTVSATATQAASDASSAKSAADTAQTKVDSLQTEVESIKATMMTAKTFSTLAEAQAYAEEHPTVICIVSSS